MSVSELIAPWTTINEALGLSAPIRDEAHYQELMAFVDECFKLYGGEDAHPIFVLVSLVADRIREYEDRVHPWPALAANEMMRELMAEHGLTQSDLPEVGTQSVVSEILADKRKLNLRQVKALAARFRVSMEVFAG